MWLFSRWYACLLLHQCHITLLSFVFVQESLLLSDSSHGRIYSSRYFCWLLSQKRAKTVEDASFSKWQTSDRNTAGDSFCCAVREVTKHSWRCRDRRLICSKTTMSRRILIEALSRLSINEVYWINVSGIWQTVEWHARLVLHSVSFLSE